MATTNFSQSLATIDSTVIPNSAIANGAYAISGTAIDNRPTSGSVVSYDLADLRIATTVTPTAGGYITVSILPAIDGGTTNYASPNAASAAAPSLARATYQAAAVSTTEIVVTDIPIGPYSFKVHIQNNLGTSFTPTASQLQRRSMANW
jgi:hypothetical protein